MLRVILVTILFGIGAVLGVQSVLWAGCLLVWNDIFRPTAFARYYSWLHPDIFWSHHFCAALLLFACIFTKWKKRWTTASTVLTVILGWMWVSALCAENKQVAFEYSTEKTKLLVPVIIMSIALASRRWQQIFTYMLAYSVGVWMAWHGFKTALGGPEIHMAIPHGQMTDRNDFLVAGTACLPLLLYVAWHFQGRWQKWVRLGTKAMCGMAVVIFFTALSRGAMLGLSALAIYYVVATGRFGRKLMVILVLACMVLPAVPDFVWGRLGTIELGWQQTEGSAASRLAIMLTAVDVTLDHPIVGVGPDCFYLVAPSYNDQAIEPHCIWLKCSAEYGLTMFVFFFAAMAFFIFRLRKAGIQARKEGNKEKEAYAMALSCALFGFLATGTWTSQFLSEYLWCMVAVAGGFLANERAKAREKLLQPAFENEESEAELAEATPG